MKRKRVELKNLNFNQKFRDFVTHYYDSSSSSNARVYFIDKDEGYFLKCASKGVLAKEVQLTQYFAAKGLAQEVLDYVSEEKDWLLTAKVKGEDASSQIYLNSPKKLCQILAETMLVLHQLKIDAGPLDYRKQAYLKNVEKGHRLGYFDNKYLFNHQKAMSRLAVYEKVQEFSPFLKNDTIIHGDFCLPNIILNEWNFQALIDWDSAGIGDKHIDIYWVLWSLAHNLGTEHYHQYFLDCYGKEKLDLGLLEAIAYFEVFG